MSGNKKFPHVEGLQQFEIIELMETDSTAQVRVSYRLKADKEVADLLRHIARFAERSKYVKQRGNVLVVVVNSDGYVDIRKLVIDFSVNVLNALSTELETRRRTADETHQASQRDRKSAFVHRRNF